MARPTREGEDGGGGALPRRARALVPFVLAGLVLVAGAVLWWTGEWGRLWELFSDRERLQGAMDGAGVLAPALYVALLVAQAVVAPLPAPAVAVAGGYTFGVFEGFLLTWLGALLGGVGCFALSRAFGRRFVARVPGGRAQELDRYVRAHGAMLVFVLRLIPLVSFDAISYAAGLSGLPFRKFLLASALGMAPGTFVFVYLGGAASGWGASAALVGLAAVAVLAYVVYVRRYRGKLDRVK